MRATTGIGILIVGLIVLTGAYLIFTSVPAWGDWVLNYPNTVAAEAAQLPAQQQAALQPLGLVLLPLLTQVGGYVKTAGYFLSSAVTLIGLIVSSVGIMLISRRPE